MSRTRTRGTKGQAQDVLGKMTQYASGNEIYSNEILSPRYYRSYEYCADEVHPDYPKSGGPLSIHSYRPVWKDAHVKTGYQWNYAGYTPWSGQVHEGNRRCVPTTLNGYPSDGFETCKSLGPEAWNRFKPRIAKVSLGQFLAEIKDTPQLLKFQLKKFKDLGSGYLNYSFGWKPFVSDLRSWYQSIIKIDEQIAVLKKHNNKWLKRGGTLYENEEETSDEACYLSWNNYCSNYKKKRVVTTYEKAWFSGAFRYYIPGLDDGKWGDLKAMQNLWGLELTPALVYELLPYSWLVDWFSNVGDVMSNYTSVTNDNMAAKYAYIMRETRTKVKCDISFDASFNVTGVGASTSVKRCTASSEIDIKTKSRATASPYGFDVGWADFTQFQLSILAALGISRQRF